MLVLLGLAGGGAAPAALAAEAVRTDKDVVAPGATVTVNASGFPARRAVELGAGPPHSEYLVIDTGLTDAAGSVDFHPRIDGATPTGTIIVFVVATEDLMIKAESPPVEILPAPGS
ncbi:hypothetical protein ACM64Y_18800 [Novispirillum sp. DQ9]|uniref:hypothetical protein n=1 Tax=Novispirillum sp. DQ9 TaxID=3398612 RepID=UPI003C7B63A3